MYSEIFMQFKLLWKKILKRIRTVKLNKQIKILIIIIISSFQFQNDLFGQDSITGENGESKDIKRAIPNWKKSTITNKINNIVRFDSLGNKFTQSHSRGTPQYFIEDKRNPGYPIGWSTNSLLPILNKKESINKIEIDNDQIGIYLEKYIDVNPGKKYQVIISFENYSNIELKIEGYNNKNEKESMELNRLLPKGKIDGFKFNIENISNSVRLITNFHKDSKGIFVLKNWIVKEVER